MAIAYHNISGELTQELLAVGDDIKVSSISLTNVDSSVTTVNGIVDLYIEKRLLGKFYLLKSVSIPVGSTLILDGDDIKFSTKTNQFGLFIKLTKGTTFTLTGTIDPTASKTVTGVGTLFLTEVSIGDEIVVSGETRIISSITSNTSLTVSVAFSNNANDTTPDCNPVAPIDVIIS
tara:strand:- start:306 stop:833 length:528 start_codon:yes stop_codon:yes gene_type:complete